MRSILFIGFLFCFVLSAQAQDLNWAVDPIITDMDKLSSTIHDGPKLLMLAGMKDGKAGVKNIKNKVVVPFKFERSELWIDGKYGAGRSGSDLYFADFKGKQVDYKSVVEVEKDKQNAIYSAGLRDKAMEKLSKMHPDIKPKAIDDSKIGIFNKVSQSIMYTMPSSNYLKHMNFTKDGLLLLVKSNWGKGLDVYGLGGELMKSFDDTHYFKDTKGRFVTIMKNKKYALLDIGMNEILPYEYESIKLYDHGYFLKSSAESSIVDATGNKHAINKGERLTEVKGTNRILITGKERVAILDVKTGHLEKFDHTINKVKYKSNVQYVKESNGKTNVWDLVTGTLLLENGFDVLGTYGGFLVGMDGALAEGAKFNNTKGQKVVLNKGNGEAMLEKAFSKFNTIGKSYFMISGEGMPQMIYDNTGQLVHEVAETDEVKLSDDTYFVSIQKAGSEPQFVLASDYFSGNKSNSYSKVSKVIKNRDGSLYYPVQKGGKFGFISRDGKTTVPPVLESAKVSDSGGKYIIAKYKGKFGVLHNPLYAK